MKIINFIKSLLPHIDKEDVMEDIDNTKSELVSGVIPSYQSASIYFKASGVKSDSNLDIQKVFYRNYEIKSRKTKSNMVEDISTALANVKINLDYLSDQVENLFNRDIIKDGLTIRKAILLRGVEHMTFISRYAVDLLNLIYINEAKSANSELTDGFSASDRTAKLTEKNLFIFARLLYWYSRDLDKFQVTMSRGKEAILNDDTIQNVVSLYKEEEVDPISSGLVNEFEGNPIYHLRLVIAEWQSDRYKSFKDKKKMLELRLLHLKSMETGSDPKLEKEIEYIQDRITSIEYKMSKMEV